MIKRGEFQLQDFFAINDMLLQQNLDTYRNISYVANRAVLYGTNQSGKSSLLFQMALNSAIKGEYVAFICMKHKLITNPPSPFIGMKTISDDILSKILIYYFENDEQIRTFFAQVHKFPNEFLPSLFVIDDFTSFFNTEIKTSNVREVEQRGQKGAKNKLKAEKDLNISKTLALIQETLDFLSINNFSKRSQNQQKIDNIKQIDQKQIIIDKHNFKENQFNTQPLQEIEIYPRLLISETLLNDGTFHNLYLLHNWIQLIFAIDGLIIFHSITCITI